MVTPVREPPIREKSNATTARGILSQLNHPKKGIMARNMKNKLRKLSRRPGIANMVRMVIIIYVNTLLFIVYFKGSLCNIDV